MNDHHLSCSAAAAATPQSELLEKTPRTGRGGVAITLLCPDCRERLRVRSTRQLTSLFKDLYLQCLNIDCAGVYAASITFDRRLRASRQPNPSIKLPLAPPRNTPPANDDVPEKEASEA